MDANLCKLCPCDTERICKALGAQRPVRQSVVKAFERNDLGAVYPKLDDVSLVLCKTTVILHPKFNVRNQSCVTIAFFLGNSKRQLM